MAASGGDTTRAAIVIVGGHEGGGAVAVDPMADYGPLVRAASAHQELDEAVRRALDSCELPVCVVPMTLGRDPRLIADSARTLMSLTEPPAGEAAAKRVMLAEPFGDPVLLAGWLRVAVAGAIDTVGGAGEGGGVGGSDLAVVLTARAFNQFDDAELFRIAHMVRVQLDFPQVEVALRDGEPDLAEVVKRCEQLGARRIAAVPADFRSGLDAPMPGVVDAGPLLSAPAVAGMLATRVDSALLKLIHGDNGIAAGLDADHQHGHGGEPWHEPEAEVG